MTIPVYIIDTFTSIIFRGNPTAVCILQHKINDSEMYAIAKELNFPVTAFIEEPAENLIYPIRYFTNTGEIPACGHATLASAKALASLMTTKDLTSFQTVENIIINTWLDNDIIFMGYPKYETIDFDISGQTIKSLGLSSFKSISFCKELETQFIELEDPKILRSLTPNFETLKNSSQHLKVVVVTSVSDRQNYDFLLRSFCLWIGIDEDPVTGSVHSVLANFWKQRTGKTELRAFQASNRGGEVYLRTKADKVELGGTAIIILEGNIYLPEINN